MMISMKKVEVIVEAVYLKRLLEMFKKRGVHNYTLIRDIEGCGEHGRRMNDDVTDVDTNDYFFTLVNEEKFEQELKEDIRAFIKRYGGKCIVLDVNVIISNT